MVASGSTSSAIWWPRCPGVVRDADLSNLVHDRNLKLLFECFEANELLLRLLSLLELERVALKPEADLRAFFATQLSGHKEMRTLLRLCAHGNEKLAGAARALVVENRRCRCVAWLLMCCVLFVYNI